MSSVRPDNPAPDQSKSEQKQQPTRKLPTERIAFSKQLDILRGIGLASQGGTKAVHYSAVANVIKMNAATVALMNTFIIDSGFVERTGNDFIPHRALVEFAQAYSWNPETATFKLAPLIRTTWFGSRLLTRLSFKSMSVDETIADLAMEVSAPPGFKSQIATLIDYAEAAGLVRREGTQLSLGPTADEMAPGAPEKPVQVETAEAPPRQSGTVATGFMTTEGAIQFHVSIKVDMREMSGWQPDRITAFFSGLAQVLAAKKGTEEL